MVDQPRILCERYLNQIHVHYFTLDEHSPRLWIWTKLKVLISTNISSLTFSSYKTILTALVTRMRDLGQMLFSFLHQLVQFSRLSLIVIQLRKCPGVLPTIQIKPGMLHHTEPHNPDNYILTRLLAQPLPRSLWCCMKWASLNVLIKTR